MLVFFTGWMDPEQDAEGRQMCRDWHAALEHHSLGYYDNIEQEGATRVARNFGENYERLRKVKAAYDRAGHMERRRELSQEWADLLTRGMKPAASLIEGRRRAQVA